MKVSFTDEALEDLFSIRAFIADRNPIAADRIGRRLVELCDNLALLPDRDAPSLVGEAGENAVWPYVVVYRVLIAEVQALRVWHGAQDRGGGQ